ncbi:MAG: DEAD/DEAH box helicase [Bdellovibrionales bacterium]
MGDLIPSSYTGPGQSIDQLVACLSVNELSNILGDDITAIITSLFPIKKEETLKSIAATYIRNKADEIFSNRDFRNILFDSMSVEKKDELVKRLEISSIEKLKRLNSSEDKDRWSKMLGFFGVDAKTIIPFSLDPDQEDVMPEFGLFPHQARAADQVCAAIKGGYGRAILHMPTGAGKTRTAMHIICRFLTELGPTVIIWLASSAELLDQAADAFQSAWAKLGNRKLSIVRFWGDRSPDMLSMKDGLVVAGLQKLNAYKCKDSLALLKLAQATALVVVDEAHQAVAPTYKSLIETLSQTGSHNALLGLTATPGRTWSKIAEDEKLSDFFDGKKIMLEISGWDDPVSYLMDEGYLAKPSFRRLNYTPAPYLAERLKNVSLQTDDFESDALELLGESVARNLIIIEEIQRLLAAGHRRIILFGSSVRHAEILSAVLLALKIDSACVTGETNKTNRSRIINAFKAETGPAMVLCNFGVLTTGFDAPRTSAAVIARPTKSLVLYSQMVGRATRGPKAGGNETCEISTVVDVDLPGFGDVAEAFTNWEDVWNVSN